MSTAPRATPSTFTAEEYAARMSCVVGGALEQGFGGVVVAPGTDLVWLTGDRPTAITERLTILILARDASKPARPGPRAVRRGGGCRASARELVDWADGSDPYDAASSLMPPDGRFAISHAAWSAHLLGLQHHLPRSRFRALGESLPMLRGEGPEGLNRLAAAGVAADATYLEIVELSVEGRLETKVAADLARLLREHCHEQVDFTVVGSGPNGANPHHEAGDRRIQDGDTVVLDFGGLMYGYGSDTTTVTGGEPAQEVRDVHDIVLRAQQAAFEAVRPG